MKPHTPLSLATKIICGLTLFIVVSGAQAQPIDTPRSTIENFTGILQGRLPLSIAGKCTSIVGGWDFACIGLNVITALRPTLVIFAVFVVSLTGLNLIIRQEEELQTKSRKIIAASLSGVLLSYLIEPFIDAFYGLTTPGSVPTSDLTGGVAVLCTELTGVINYALTIAGAIAIFVIIISGVRAVVTSGTEEGLTQLRRAIVSIIIGILIVVLKEVMVKAFGLECAIAPGTPGLAAIGDKIVIFINYFLGFLGLAALIMFVYAGFSMVVSIGNEELITKAKSLMIRVVIGIAIIIMSLVIVNFVVDVF